MSRYRVNFELHSWHPSVGQYLAGQYFETVTASGAAEARRKVRELYRDQDVRLGRVLNLDLAADRASERAANRYEHRRAGV